MFRVPSAESVLQSLFPGAIEERKTTQPSPLEEEVTSLFDELRSPLLRYLLSRGMAPQDGEEVIQEVFLSLFRHLRAGKPRSNLKGWIFRVAHNLGLKRLQANRRVCQIVTNEYSGEMHLDPDPNPEERLAESQRQERLLSIVRALPEQDRSCLYLRAEGLRYRQIAEALGISLGTVALLLGRSLKRLSRVDGRS